MTNQPSNTNTVPAAKESGVSKIMGGVSWWINSLMGKPQARRVPEIPQAPAQTAAPITQEQAATAVPSTTASTAEKPNYAPAANVTQPPKTDDPIFQDFMKIKSLFGLFSGKVAEKVTPAVSKGVSSSSEAASSFVKTVDKGFMQKILRVFIVVLLLIVVGFVSFKFYSNYKKDTPGGVVNPTPGTEETPTPELTFTPKEPSVYANDPVILKLEEDINVLVREVESANIKENSINPPILNFSVTF